MMFIHGGRASGKTVLLIKQSAHTGIPILVTSYAKKKRILDNAKHLGIKIPEPVIWTKRPTQGTNFGGKVLIDDGESVLRHILLETMGAVCDVMAISDPVAHLTSCFVEDVKNYPSEIIGGQFEYINANARCLCEWETQDTEEKC